VIVRLGRSHDGDVHAFLFLHLRIINLREDQLVAQAQRVVTTPIERLRGDALEIAHTGQSHIHEAVEELEVRTGVSELSVGFNVNYLLDALNALQGEEVLLCLRDANSSCLLRIPGSEKSRHVIMPLRL